MSFRSNECDMLPPLVNLEGRALQRPASTQLTGIKVSF
jgi:hypothetical protein